MWALHWHHPAWVHIYTHAPQMWIYDDLKEKIVIQILQTQWLTFEEEDASYRVRISAIL